MNESVGDAILASALDDDQQAEEGKQTIEAANTSALEKKLKEKTQQLKKLAKAFFLLQQEKRDLEEYCILIESENMEFKKAKEQMDFLKSRDDSIAKQHQKLLENEERHIQQLEKDMEKIKEEKKKLQIKVRDHFLPEIKKLQVMNSKLDQNNLMLKRQIKDLKKEITEKDKLIAEYKKELSSGEAVNSAHNLQLLSNSLNRENKELKQKLTKKIDLCKTQQTELTELRSRVTELEEMLNKKAAWNSQTQLFYTEKKEYIEQLKREKLHISRQLRRETKRAIKREDVINELIERNGKLRNAFLASSISPPTVVEHFADQAFYESVSKQITMIQRQLDLERPEEQVDPNSLDKVVTEAIITTPSSPPRIEGE
ncbi:hypothetical protein ABK040_001854 [Willaertia magna]